MSDLTKEQLEGMDMWGDDREVMFARKHQAVGAYLVGLAVAEIKRRRAEEAAWRDHVYQVVDDLVYENLPTNLPLEWQTLISTTVAKAAAARLSVPVLSDGDRMLLIKMRCGVFGDGSESTMHGLDMEPADLMQALAVLDRLIAAGKPAHGRALDGSPGWRAGIEACIRKVKYRKSVMPDLQKPAYTAALDDLLLHFEAMLERGTERSTTEVAAVKP